MVTIKTYSSLMDADLARAHLESSGVNAFIQNEGTASWILGAPPMVQGVNIQVANEDVERAVEILKAMPVGD